MRVLHSKHQKLILQCYPPGKGVDKKPNPSELSYLLYYATTRRVKLEKVIDFLDHKTKRDARSAKSGNLQVTLDIVLALIEKCSDNLNAFASQVCSILLSVLNTKELPLCKSLVGTYGVFCSRLDGGLFSGDKDFVDLFTLLTEQLIATGVNQSKLQAPNLREWHMVALMTCRHVFNCLGFNAQLSKKFMGICVPLLTDTVLSASNYSNLLTRLNSNLNVDLDPLSKTTTAKPRANDNFENDLVNDEDLNQEALGGLRTLFNTSLSIQISDATREVVDNNFRISAQTEQDAWGTTFLEMCASWIPVQLRFVTLLTLLARLSTIADQASSKASNSDQMAHYAKYVLGLVSSNFNMIGLSISDVNQHLLTLQTDLHLHLADYLLVEEVQNLSDIYSQCICNLSSHIYYFDQVPDSIEGVLMQIDTVLISATPRDASRVSALVETLLGTVATILKLLGKKSSSIARNHATLENWDGSLLLLSIKTSFKEFAALASTDQISGIQRKYLAVFRDFITTELIRGDDKESSDASVPLSPLLIPNNNGYIESPQNFLARLFVHVNECLETAQVSVVHELVVVLKELLSITGVNFVYNFMPFFLHWQLVEPSTDVNDCTKDTVAYILLQSLIQVLSEKYPETLGRDLTQLDFYLEIKSDIQNRRSLGVWVGEVDGSTVLLTKGSTVSIKVNRKLLYEFFAHTPLHKYINTQKNVEEGDAYSEVPSDRSSEHQFEDARPSNGFGLGNANDISSIHSGLLHGKPDISYATNNSLLEHNYRLSLLPRVEDLRQSVTGAVVSDLFSFTHAHTTPRSVLQKQMHEKDVSTIISGLASDEDKDIVV